MTHFLPLRRAERGMSESDAWDFLGSADVTWGVLGTHGVRDESGFPYVVPMNFAADRGKKAIYLHATSDPFSKRYRALAENSKVTFVAVDPANQIDPNPDGVACDFSTSFISVMVFGQLILIGDQVAQKTALDLLLTQKAGKFERSGIPTEALDKVNVYRIEVEHLTGKRRDQRK